MNWKLAIAAALGAAFISPSLHAGNGESGPRWVTTWQASPQPLWDKDFILPTGIPDSLQDSSMREVVRISAGGKRLRLVFSNRYGAAPVRIAETTVALSVGGDRIDNSTMHVVTFDGDRGVTMLPHASVVSDPIDFEVPALAQLAVTTYFQQRTALSTFHWGQQQTGFITAGNAVTATASGRDKPLAGRLFLSGVMVESNAVHHTVVAFGDSITDGNGSTPDAHRRWPDALARRLAARHIAVVNAGISGARVLGDKMGMNALARLEQDVFSHPGPKTLILLMGINDIGWPGSPFAPGEKPMTAAELIAGYRQIISAARAHQVRVFAGTLLPFEDALQGTPYEGHYSPGKERLRQEVNHWIRTAGAFDAVVDFDAVLRDPKRPTRMLPAFDSGDHLHPGDAGYQAMADAIDCAALFGVTCDVAQRDAANQERM